MGMTAVTIRLPEELPSALHRSPNELEKDITLAAAIDWYRQGLISRLSDEIYGSLLGSAGSTLGKGMASARAPRG